MATAPAKKATRGLLDPAAPVNSVGGAEVVAAGGAGTGVDAGGAGFCDEGATGGGLGASEVGWGGTGA